MAVAGQLFRLEQLDSEIEQRESALLELQRRHKRNAEVEAADVQVAELQGQQEKLTAEQRSQESDLSDLEARIKRDHTRMYSGQIVDARELASLEREIEHHRSQRDATEERVLELMEQLESVESRLSAQTNAAEEARGQWQAERPEMARRHRAIKTEIQELSAEREALVAALDPRSLSTYTRLRSSSGHAVSHVSDGVCQWCRVTLPPKDVQHARTDLVTCTNCARILYIGP